MFFTVLSCLITHVPPIITYSELNIAFFNDLVEDPDECRCSGDPDACQPLKHILQDCAGVPVVDTALHWSNPGGPNLDIAVCAHGENLARTDCTGKNTYVYDGPVGNVAHVRHQCCHRHIV